jgi:hypothetical protein
LNAVAIGGTIAAAWMKTLKKHSVLCSVQIRVSLQVGVLFEFAGTAGKRANKRTLLGVEKSYK